MFTQYSTCIKNVTNRVTTSYNTQISEYKKGIGIFLTSLFNRHLSFIKNAICAEQHLKNFANKNMKSIL